jgi:hypothetical protein
MAKTDFNDGNPSLGILGTRVLAAWLNKVFGHRHTGQDIDGSAPLDYAVDGSIVANQFAINLVPPLAAHVPGLPIYFKASQSNSAAVTIIVDGLAPAPLTKTGGVPIAANDIIVGTICLVVWDGAQYQLVSTGFTKAAADALYAASGHNHDGTYLLANAQAGDAASVGGKSLVPIASGVLTMAAGAMQVIQLAPSGSSSPYQYNVYGDRLVVQTYSPVARCAYINNFPLGGTDTLMVNNLGGEVFNGNYTVSRWQ